MSSKDNFIQTLSSVKRDGIEKILGFLEKSTFYTDPASTEGHNSKEGGLLEHSLAVYNLLVKHAPKEVSEDSLKIVGLLHDVSLIGCFQKFTKNIPMKGPDGKNKHREDGRILFVEKETYDFVPEVQLPYPHGQLSNQIIRQYIKLSKLEDLAIFWHHSLQEVPNAMAQRALKTHKLIFLTASLDLEAKLFCGE
jgi:hypothetical protein